MGKKIDLTGQVFGRLTVLREFHEKTRDNKYKYECICSCGNSEVVIKTASLLRSGQTKSCGCLQRENAKLQCENNRVDNPIADTPTYIAWKNMKARCDDINHQAYENYGARGITYDQKWSTFNGYLEDMGEVPEKLTLNRIDVNLNYSKENCEWADNYKQGRDRRKPKNGKSSQYKGVSFNKAEGKYKCSVRYKGVIYHLGYHLDPLVLALRYDEKVIELTGSDSGTNKQLGLL